MTFRTFYIDNKATYALDELVAPIAKPFQSDKTGSVPEGGEVIVHIVGHVCLQKFSSVEGALHKYVHPRRAQRPNTRREQLPPYLFQVQLTSLLSMKTTWFWSERQLNSLDETMIFQVWNE